MQTDLLKGSDFHDLLHCRCQCRVKSILQFRLQGANPSLIASQTTLLIPNIEFALLNLYDNVYIKTDCKSAETASQIHGNEYMTENQ